MSASAARMVALEVVTRVRERGAYAHETLDTVLRTQRLEERDAAFATRLAYGAIAARGTLDEATARFLKDPSKLEPAVGDALAVSAYELLFMRTPNRAAVNEGVELVRGVQPRAAGLANAVLRRLSESRDAFPWGDPTVSVAALARLHAHPEWMASLWVEERGWEAAVELMAANNEPAPLYLAHLPFRSNFDEVVRELTDAGALPSACAVPGCIVVDRASAALASSAVCDRRVLVVDQAAQLTAATVGALPGQTIVEIGAGRGTKSILIAAHALRAGGAPASVIAVDSHQFKLDVLEETARSAGATGITAIAADATKLDRAGAPTLLTPRSADCVLIDAPCSGLGTLRRHPDRRWRARPAEIQALAAIGSLLLASAALLVKPGGFVVYSTCTVAHAENEAVIKGFLESSSGAGFSVDSLEGLVEGELGEFVTPQGYFQSVPRIGGPDGHFIARLKYEG